MRKRAKIEVIYDILSCVQKLEPAKPTNIMYKSNLSYPLMNKFLLALCEDGLVRKSKSEDKTTYYITDGGVRFLKLLRKLNSMTQMIEVYSDRRTKKGA